jgi:hypothetical protein
MSLEIDSHAIHSAYDSSALSTVFVNNDTVQELSQSEAPIYNAAFEADPGTKRHAACDECRKRKLKCSGEPTGCSRCIKQALTCHFSKQAVMGRPRKKRKTSEEAGTVQARQIQVSVEKPIPDFVGVGGRDNFDSVCPGPVTQYIKRRIPAPAPPFLTQSSLHEQSGSFFGTGSEGTPPTDSPPTPTLFEQAAYPTDVANWPDFSTMTMLPQIVQDNHPEVSSSSEYSQPVESADANRALPPTPACPCLPNIYLTLSSLSTLTSFPISIHTIESLQTAHRTAQSVLYCTICPTKFQSGMQNVMLSGTLLTVLADHWSRVRTASAHDLRHGFTAHGNKSDVSEPPLTEIESFEWRTFAYYLVRANVFGDKLCPLSPHGEPDVHPDEASPEVNLRKLHRLVSTCLSKATPTLQELIEAMERRQCSWHDQIPDTGEFPRPLTDAALHDHIQGISGITHKQIQQVERAADGHLCLKIVRSVKFLLQTLETPAPTM